MTPLSHWRDEFPAVKNKIFLGAHTLAPLSRRARAAINTFLDAWETKASAERVWFEDIIPEMRRTEALYASLIGADADEVVLTPSVSTGLSSIASCIDFSQRSEVVVSRDEFPTDCHVWLAQASRGAEIKWADGHSTQSFLNAISDQTAIVSASRVSYLDAEVIDVELVASAARNAGAMCVLDDYHGSGVIPIDVHAVGNDVMVGGPLKYLLGGPGIAFLYVKRDRIPSLNPTVTGWFSQSDFFAFDPSGLDWPDTAQKFAMGTPSPASIFAAAAGLEIITEVGVPTIRARVLELGDDIIERALARGLVVRTPIDHQRRGGLIAIEVADSKTVLHRLLEREVIVDERHGALRLSAHFYTNQDDIEGFFAALDAILT